MRPVVGVLRTVEKWVWCDGKGEAGKDNIAFVVE
jgi:hypothetical protein